MCYFIKYPEKVTLMSADSFKIAQNLLSVNKGKFKI